MSSSYTNAEQKMRPPQGGRRRRRQSSSAAATAGAGADEADASIASAPPQVTYEQEDGANDDGTSLRSTTSHPHGSNNKHKKSPPHPPSASFQDQLAASALSGTIEFLKVAGGLTLNATGKVVAPPLHVTKTYLLPALWAAFVDYLSTSTPKRAKDWFRILSTSIQNLIIALRETEKGQIFRQRLVLWGADLIDCLSADSTRQVLVDGMTTFLKFIEALHTPECRECLDQFTILSCRVTQALASGRSQQAMHDFKTVLWSGVELLADPSSTTAFAEVTAYLCHALEMEDAILDGAFHSQTNQERTNRRKERDVYQTETFQGKTTLVNNPEATVEQVILSSLGGGSATNTTTSDVPGAVESSHDIIDSPETLYTEQNVPPSESGTNVVFQSEAGSIRQQVEEASTHTGGESDDEDDEQAEWHDQAQSNVNVQMLKREISKRAERLGRNDIPRNIPAVTTTIARDDNRNIAVSSKVDQEVPDGEATLERFYRVLDNVMKEKRVEGIDHILASYADGSAKSYLREGKVHKPVGHKDTDLLAETIRSRLAHIRADINKELDSDDREKLKRMDATLKRNSWAVYAAIAFVLGFILLWIALGCYGIYVLVYPSLAGPVQEILSSTQNPMRPPTMRPIQYENEVVIRLVREVVHTDGTGFVLERRPEQTHLSRERIEKISECISESVDTSLE